MFDVHVRPSLTLVRPKLEKNNMATDYRSSTRHSSDRHALEEMDKTTARMERMFRRLHMRLDAVNPGDVSFS